MKTIDKSKPVLVTGATGYLASWIVKQLLDEGYPVHATVRNKQQTKKYEYLLQLASESKGKLAIFEADLLNEGSFKEAMQNCELVIHTASPFKISGIKDAQKELVEPALKGTQNVLNTATDECEKSYFNLIDSCHLWRQPRYKTSGKRHFYRKNMEYIQLG